MVRPFDSTPPPLLFTRNPLTALLSPTYNLYSFRKGNIFFQTPATLGRARAPKQPDVSIATACYFWKRRVCGAGGGGRERARAVSSGHVHSTDTPAAHLLLAFPPPFYSENPNQSTDPIQIQRVSDQRVLPALLSNLNGFNLTILSIEEMKEVWRWNQSVFDQCIGRYSNK